MSGTFLRYEVKVGQEIKSGENVLVIESMKMEINVKAGLDGTITSINVAMGQNVEEGDTIFIIG